jgi:hypothetical protein
VRASSVSFPMQARTTSLRRPGNVWLLLQVTLLLIGIRTAMLLLRYSTLNRLMDRPVRDVPLDPAAEARVTWAIQAIGRRVGPLTTCLGMAMAARLLLARRGIASDVRFGVGRDADSTFRAHAWLECRGRVVVGRRFRVRFTSLGPAA